jgi:ABC-type lipoprotein export system ATPase subunit
MEDFIRLDNVSRTFDGPNGQPLAILRDLTWQISEGDTVAVAGPSGSGKSTLLNLIGALDRPTSGSITVGGQRLDTLDAAGLATYRAQHVGFIFQDHHLLPQLTALENVLLPTLAAQGTAERAGGPARPEGLLERVGLAERLHSFPAQLSGGERQRVAIARALMNQPRLLLCDEPTGNLDQATGAQVVALLMELAQSGGLTVLMVTHNPAHAAACRLRFELREGRLAPSEDQP